ncbi:alcohol dehydrogenase catalytic domain-containing protein [Gordonia hydrophobica]|uniref:Alcohol dehydrogenase catalytic domain-containing protein n=1 Tax=Gordonia hydrophobica TaxID=40516 RepID=A0ABZ2TZI7_9ACTN|nr:alcohol dehydrogenase catalytic domain-containing protein [Gordonia hydrophobica]MBM7365810.1 (R,R)-butanediol dehydrogenase/meso-butanediol dehydrogenase/diacetyl reductase [Gordonia hydrophobica]
MASADRGAVYYGVGDLRIEEIVLPDLGVDEIRIDVAYCGVCGSDLHEYFAHQTVTPVGAHPLTGQSLPVVLGHEFSGTVVAMGSAVTDLAVGDRVAVRPTYSCGVCVGCTHGLPNVCASLAFHGLSGPGGGLSTSTVVKASMAFRLPAEVSLLSGALVEPMAVARHGVGRVVDSSTKVAFVGGAGPIGLGALFALRAAGVSDILVCDLSSDRREVAARHGAEVFDPRERAVVDVLDGRNLDVAVEAAGVGAVLTEAISALGPRGQVVVLGIHEGPTAFDPTSLLYREVSVHGSSTYTDDDFRAVIAEMAAGGYDPDGWVQTRPLDSVCEAFDELRAGGPTKILITPKPL